MISRLLEGCSDDLGSMVLWWTNCVHLRGFMQSLSLTGGDDHGSHWAGREFVSPLAAMEEAIFERVCGWARPVCVFPDQSPSST